MSNVDKLAKARAIDRKQLSKEERQLIESLSSDEVDTLVNVKKKLDAGLPGKKVAAPMKII